MSNNNRQRIFSDTTIKRYLSIVVSTLVGSILYHHPVRASDAIMIRPERVISVITSDWNGDGAFDRAILIESDLESNQVDLLIYLSESSSSSNMRLAAGKKNIVWRGGMWGTQPTLEINAQRSLVITSGNDAIGRNRWNQKLTLLYRDKSFVIAGYTRIERDTIDPNFSSSCDVNFLTNKGFKNKKPFMISTKAVDLKDWSQDSIPKECR